MNELRAVDAQDVTRTWDCKQPGCDGEARADRGPYAYLCDYHTEQRRREISGRGSRPQAGQAPAPGEQLLPTAAAMATRSEESEASRA